jgi:hypothetical protein
VQRNVVTNFFLSLYWSKRFRDLKSGKITPAAILSRHNSTNVPQIRVDDASETPSQLVPEIRVESGEIPQITFSEDDGGAGPVTPPRQPSIDLGFGETSGFSPIESPPPGAFSFASIDPFAPRDENTLRQRGTGRRTPLPFIQTPNLSPSTSPMMSPTQSPRLGPQEHPLSGWFGTTTNADTARERQPSDVAPQIVMDALDDSDWRDQIRSFIEGEMGGISRTGSVNGDRSPRSPLGGSFTSMFGGGENSRSNSRSGRSEGR